MQNHFELFHLPVAYAIDLSALDAAYRDVHNQVHPDRYVTASDAEKRVAMQWATRANEAYETLKHPIARARYLCELKGMDLQVESNTSMPADFLMQQMERREALDDAVAAADVGQLEKLARELRQQLKSEAESLTSLFDQDLQSQIATRVRQLMFLDRLAHETVQAINRLDA